MCDGAGISDKFCLFCLSGTYCNSASACFVASDGKNLRLYQAVVDARKLLDELSDPETSVSRRTHHWKGNQTFFGCSLECYNIIV